MNKQELLKKLAGGETFEFEGFQRGVHSPGYHAEFIQEGRAFKNIEQFYQFKKASLFNDDKTAEKILKTSDPIGVRRLGKQVKGFNQAKWDQEIESVLFIGNMSKYMQNKNDMRVLLETEDKVLAYMNPADTIWGTGLDMMDSRIKEPFEWPGENILGFVLMEVRNELKELA
jgi:ribA/ribD-fused uncharacterized protein